MNALTYIIIVFILFKGYDVIRRKWEIAPTETYSKAWHLLGFLLLAFVSAYEIYNQYGLTFDAAIMLFQVATAMWVIFDAVWGAIFMQNPFYPGDGKGGFIEIIINFIATKLGVKFWIMTWFLKMIAITICFTI